MLVFFHGGGFQDGDAQLYPGYALAAGSGAIVVTAQYRVNVFGFLYLGSPAVAPHGDGATNAGLEDQREALRWVRRSIGAFGGDPRRVTIFGQSAGGASVATHLTTPNSQLNFARHRTKIISSQ